MKGFGEKKQLKNEKNSHKNQDHNIDKLIKKAFNLQSQGKKLEAAKYYSYLIKKGLKDYRVFSNYGAFLQEVGKFREAEIELKKAIKLNPKYPNSHYNLAGLFIQIGNLDNAEIHLRKAIELKSDFAIAYYNLGFILKDLGRLEEAEKFTKKAIDIDPNLTDAYFSLSTLINNDKKQKWHDQLFSEKILKNKDNRELINIFFARSNILHKDCKYQESAENLIAANNIKISMNKSSANLLIKKTEKLKFHSKYYENNFHEVQKNPISIFIVGLPRCGSTLVESIISLNSQVKDLGEVNIFETSYKEYLQLNKKISLAEIYRKNSKVFDKSTITTNKWLFNYQYAGIISSNIPNAKIIHCFRNPLDNILSIYRAHFKTGNTFSSSLIDCAEIYNDQEAIMKTYKKKYRSQIYDLNYDKLVGNPLKEIKSLIIWLGWEWNDLYLSPHLNKRKILTRSNVEVRSPINTKSLGGWKNYKEMLKPCIEILINKGNFKE